MCVDVGSVVSATHGAVGQIIERREPGGGIQSGDGSGGGKAFLVYLSLSVSVVYPLSLGVCCCCVNARRMWSSQ